MKIISKSVLVQIGLWCLVLSFFAFIFALKTSSNILTISVFVLFMVGLFSLLGALFIPASTMVEPLPTAPSKGLSLVGGIFLAIAVLIILAFIYAIFFVGLPFI
jgi:hypothetical protein